MQPIIETRSLTKTFGTNGVAVHALRGIDMEVARGEFVALIGPSGSGKSTLMAILGCLDKPTSGTYALDGQRVDGLSGPELARIRNTTSCPRPRSCATSSCRCSTRGSAARSAASGR